jgi:hypothetical protein
MSALPPPNPRVPPLDILLGIGLGLIPVILGLLGVGLAVGNTTVGPILLLLALAGYLTKIVAAIFLINRSERKGIGYGLLVMVFIGPVVWSVGCIVVLTGSSGGNL